MITRFAPSTTGHAHPGTLMSALLCWLAARRAGGRVILRLEDLDPQRCRPELTDAMINELAWFGLDWDDVVTQSHFLPAHEQALDRLAEHGLLYPCACSRSRLKALGKSSPEGGFAYDNHCRMHPLPPGGWRSCREPLRVRLPPDDVALTDEGGLLIRQRPEQDLGDPVVRRRDGAIAYHLACVVDDAAMAASHLIRGMDLAPCAPVQILLQRMLGFPTPVYRHHFLLLEPHGDKLAKFHGSVSVPELMTTYTAEALCGFLAQVAGIMEDASPVRPRELVDAFSWDRIRTRHATVLWDGHQLTCAS